MDLNIALSNQAIFPNADYFEEEKRWEPIGFQDNEEIDIDPVDLNAAILNLQADKNLVIKDAIKLDR